MTSNLGGWGAEWGSTFWGDNHDSNLELLGADTLRENVLRLVFNKAPYFSNLSDPTDGAVTSCYQITVLPDTVGLDGRPARPVAVLSATQALSDDPEGRLVDLVIDRPFSPYPGAYTVQVSNLVTDEDASPLDPGFSEIEFYGLSRMIVPSVPEEAFASRDLANPQTLGMLQETGVTTVTALGTYPTDASGDYATDNGKFNLKKRVFRRLITAKGAFLHAPGYGLGVTSRLKRLNIASEREALASEAELQIIQEPDVRKVKVRVLQDPVEPSIVRFLILIRTSQGIVEKFEVPFSAV